MRRAHREIPGPWEDKFYFLDFVHKSARWAILSVKDPPRLFRKLARGKSGREFLFRTGVGEFDPLRLKDTPLKDIYKGAYDLALSLKFSSIRSSHLLAAALSLAGEKSEDAKQSLLWEKRRRDWVRFPFIWEDDYEVGPIGGVNRGWTGRVTPTLDTFSIDLTKEAAAGRLKLMLGKQKPLEEVARVLARERKANVLLVGPPGSGKTSLAEGMAQVLVRGARFESLQGRRLVQLDVGALGAGPPTEGGPGGRGRPT